MMSKTVLITGCSDGGIGSELALAFQHTGTYHVYATARDLAKTGSLDGLSNVTRLRLDVCDQASIDLAAKTVASETGGRLDILINNAGRNHFMPVLDDNIADAKAIFDINVWGALAVTYAFAPMLLAAKGCIANITSIAGHLSVPWMGIYSASKAAQEVIGETLRFELAPLGVNVINVVTASVKTNGQSYFNEWHLPPDSLYKSIEAAISTRVRGLTPPKRLTAAQFAEMVAPQIMSGTSGRIWPGPAAQFLRFASAFLPALLLDRIMLKGTGLEQM